MQVQILQVHHGRILIDFLDPLVVSRKIATTDNTKYVTINEIVPELKDGTIVAGTADGINFIENEKVYRC